MGRSWRASLIWRSKRTVCGRSWTTRPIARSPRQVRSSTGARWRSTSPRSEKRRARPCPEFFYEFEELGFVLDRVGHVTGSRADLVVGAQHPHPDAVELAVAAVPGRVPNHVLMIELVGDARRRCRDVAAALDDFGA